jgi:RHS repeat-associated protein
MYARHLAWIAVATVGAGCGGAAVSSSASAARVTDRVVYYHATIAAGPALITRADGTLFDERRTEPFGGAIDALGGPIDYTLDPHDLRGKESDPLTGWSDHGARWLAPDTARWLTPDPPVKGPDPKLLAAPWALHPYQYVEQNPIVFWDPDGREPAVLRPGVFAQGCWPNASFPRDTPPLPADPLVRAGPDRFRLSPAAAEILRPIFARFAEGFDIERVRFTFGYALGGEAYTWRNLVTLDRASWGSSSALGKLLVATHEMTHSVQYDELGVFGATRFLARYGREYNPDSNYVPPDELVATDLDDLDPTTTDYTLDQIAERVSKEVRELYEAPNCPFRVRTTTGADGSPRLERYRTEAP